MKDYNVQIKETLIKIVTVEAENAEQARKITEQNWKNSDYILDADDFKGVTFATLKNREYER